MPIRQIFLSSMLIWKSLRTGTWQQAYNCVHHFRSCGPTRVVTLTFPTFQLPELGTPGIVRKLFTHVNTHHPRQGNSDLLRICAASKKRKEFHSSTAPQGYKSGPRRPSWKYVNPQTKPVPKPPKGARLPRFYVSTDVMRSAREGSVFQLSEAETKHALRSLRMSEGAWLEVCDGKGLLVEAQLRGLTFANRAFAIATSNPSEVPWEGPRWEVVVALGGLQGGRADNLVEKISELGAWSLRPLLTNRSRTIGRFEEKDTIRIVEVEELSDMSDVEEEDDFVRTGRFARWERVSISAGKQSLRSHSLLIRPPCVLDHMLGQIKAGCPAFVAAQGAPPLQQVLEDAFSKLLEVRESGARRPCLLLIGPEGDFTEEETKQLTEAGAKPVGLGQNRLRVETAAMAITAGAVLQYESARFRAEQPVTTAEEQKLAA